MGQVDDVHHGHGNAREGRTEARRIAGRKDRGCSPVAFPVIYKVSQGDRPDRPSPQSDLNWDRVGWSLPGLHGINRREVPRGVLDGNRVLQYPV